MTCPGCDAYDDAERAAIEDLPHEAGAPVPCTCDEPSMVFTWFRQARSTRPGLYVRMTAAELVANMQSTAVARPPEGTPQGDKSWRTTSVPLVSPATFKGGLRSNANVEAVNLLGLDIDEPTDDPEAFVRQARSALGDPAVFAYSTLSSQPNAFRMRILMPYDRPASPEEHRGSWEVVHRLLSAAGIRVDKACKDPARGFFVWAIPSNGVYWSGHIDGTPWPVSKAADVWRRQQAFRATATAASASQALRLSTGNIMARARAYLVKCDPAIEGQHGSDQTFTVAAKLIHGFGLHPNDVFDLMRSEFNPKCDPPWSDRDLARKVSEASAKATTMSQNQGFLLNQARPS